MAKLSFHLTGLKHSRLTLKDEKGNDVTGTFIPDARNDLKPTDKGAIYINCWINDINEKLLAILKKNGQDATHTLQLRFSEEMSKKVKSYNEANPDKKIYAPNLGVIDMGGGKSGSADPSANVVKVESGNQAVSFDDDDAPF